MSVHLLTRESGKYCYRTIDEFKPNGSDYVLLIDDTANRQHGRHNSDGYYELVARSQQNIGQPRMPIMRPMVFKMRLRLVDGEINCEVFHFFNLDCGKMGKALAGHVGRLFTGADIHKIMIVVYSAFRALSIAPLSQQAVDGFMTLA